MRVWCFAFAVTITVLIPRAGWAQQAASQAGVSLVFVHGQHVETGGTTNAPFIPAPVLNASTRLRQFEITAEGIPPLRSYPIGNNGLGIQNISLSYVEGSLRYWDKTGTFAAGIGETLYNQRTDYVSFSDSNGSIGQYDGSRVAGTRYELVARRPLRFGDTIEASLAVNPSLHGLVHWTDYDIFRGRMHSFDLRPGYEAGSQVEAALRFDHAVGPYTLRYGVRYLNYVAHFSNGNLADRNTFVMPFVGIERSLGR